MNKNTIYILIICAALLLTGCVTHDQTPTAGGLPQETQAQPQEMTQAPTEEKIPGLEDSIFDEFWVGEIGNQTPGETKPENTGSDEETTAATEPPYAESRPEQSQGGDSSGEMTYEKYTAMSGDDQMEFFNTFASVEAFMDWYNAAKEKYEAENPAIEIEGGEIDLDSIFGGN